MYLILFVFEIETREAFTAPYENVCAAQIQLKMEITLVQITRRIERYSNIATFYLVRVLVVCLLVWNVSLCHYSGYFIRNR